MQAGRAFLIPALNAAAGEAQDGIAWPRLRISEPAKVPTASQWLADPAQKLTSPVHLTAISLFSKTAEAYGDWLQRSSAGKLKRKWFSSLKSTAWRVYVFLPSFLPKEENKPLFPEGKPYLRVSVKHQRRKEPSDLKAAELKSAAKQISN